MNVYMVGYTISTRSGRLVGGGVRKIHGNTLAEAEAIAAIIIRWEHDRPMAKVEFRNAVEVTE